MSDKNTISSTSQKFLDIHDIVNDILILKNGSTAIVLTVNAMNFGLLAEQEQDAVIYSYASLLNSINYPIQILIQSQTKDASSYLKLLEKRKEKTTDQVKKAWIKRYSNFVSNLIKERNVLDKKFYVIIPASSLEMGLTLKQDIISGFKEQSIEGIEKSIILEKAQNLLEPKRDHLIAQFNRIGLYARQLTTQEIIKLFYTNYNPEATEGQQITNSQSYTTALVQAKIRGDFMNNPPTAPVPAAGTAPNTKTAPNAKADAAITNDVQTQATSPVQVQEQAQPTQTPVPTQPTMSQSAMPQPATPSTPATIPNLAESPTIQAPASPASPVSAVSAVSPVSPADTADLQANINQAINQLKDQPAQ